MNEGLRRDPPESGDGSWRNPELAHLPCHHHVTYSSWFLMWQDHLTSCWHSDFDLLQASVFYKLAYLWFSTTAKRHRNYLVESDRKKAHSTCIVSHLCVLHTTPLLSTTVFLSSIEEWPSNTITTGSAHWSELLLWGGERLLLVRFRLCKLRIRGF